MENRISHHFRNKHVGSGPLCFTRAGFGSSVGITMLFILHKTLQWLAQIFLIEFSFERSRQEIAVLAVSSHDFWLRLVCHGEPGRGVLQFEVGFREK